MLSRHGAWRGHGMCTVWGGHGVGWAWYGHSMLGMACCMGICAPVEEGLDVARADDVDAARVERGGEGQTRKARVPAVGAAVDADLVLNGDALVHRPRHRVSEVVLHVADAPALVTLVKETLAVARGAAVVDLVSTDADG